jgi:hypothetical protein
MQRVDLEQDRDAVSRATGDLGRGHLGVEPSDTTACRRSWDAGPGALVRLDGSRPRPRTAASTSTGSASSTRTASAASRTSPGRPAPRSRPSPPQPARPASASGAASTPAHTPSPLTADPARSPGRTWLNGLPVSRTVPDSRFVKPAGGRPRQGGPQVRPHMARPPGLPCFGVVSCGWSGPRPGTGPAAAAGTGWSR